MTLRGIPVLRDTDEQDSVPAWRGDHTFSSDAASYSLSHFIEPEVKREHPDWTQEQISSVASQRFEQRLAQDLSYEHQESAHEESVVHWQPVKTASGSWELATSYGDSMVTLSELWEHTREYAEFAGNPAAYNSEEHRAQIQMQEELISGGANGFVSVLSHPDAVRYVQVWQKTEDGSIVSKQVDLYKTTGRDFTHDEGAKLIDNLANYFKEDVGGGEASVISYAHIYIHEKEIAEDDIRTIAIAQTMEAHDVTVPERYVPNVLFRAGEQTVRDTTESMIQLGVYLREHIDKKIAAFTHIDVDSKKRETTTSILSKQELSYVRIPKDTPLGPSRIDTHINYPDVQLATDAMKSLEADWWIVRSMLRRKDAFPTAPIAILLWMTESESMLLPDVHENVPFSFAEKNRSTEPTRMQKIGASIRYAIAYMLRESEKKHTSTRRELRVKVSSEYEDVSGHPVISEGFKTTYEDEVSDFSLSLSTVDSLLIILRKIGMHDALVSIYRRSVMRDLPGTLSDHGLNREYAVEVKSDKKPYVETAAYDTRQVAIAIIVWWLTEYSRRTFQKSDALLRPEHVHTVTEDVHEEESRSTPWLLLSIIWYLAAIREHGKQSAVQKKSAGKKKSKQSYVKTYATLPPTGIIFTFGS